MGIKGLTKFLGDYAPKAIQQQAFGSMVGRVLAIDASMSLYQFMIAIRDSENFGNLTNEAGETTSHLTGMISRVVRLMEHGIKPVYVFDGKPPELKSGELAKRGEKRAKAEEELKEAQEKGIQEDIKKFMGRTVKVTKQHNEDVKHMLRLLGVPVIEAPCEAEAQCAYMAKKGVAYASATEDADALTFGSPVLVRHLNFSDQKAKSAVPLMVLYLEVILKELDITMDQFVDFCILSGCDYCDTIKGVGAVSAYKMIKQHKTIEAVLEKLDTTKYPLPESFPYQEARRFFMDPAITPVENLPKLTWSDPDEEGLRELLVVKNNFAESRVEKYLQRIKDAKGKSNQTRLDNFFGARTIVSSTLPKPKAQAKGRARGKAGARSKPSGPQKRKSEASPAVSKKAKVENS